MHNRSLNRVIVLVVLTAMLAPVNWGAAAPLDSTGENRMQAQTGEETPPLIEPIDGSTPEDQPVEEETDSLPAIEIGEDLGDGGQPEGLPREIGVGDERYLYDRGVALDTGNLAPIASDETLAVYAATEEGPFDAIYVTMAGGSEGQPARYLPERLASTEIACPAEVADIGQLNTGQDTYIFAGIESDLTPDVLQAVGDSNGQTVYADPEAPQPLPEVFIEDAQGLLRFVIAGNDGRPESLAESLAFGGVLLQFAGDATEGIDPASLTKAGCAGPYPVYAAQGEADAGTTNRYVRAGGRLFQFSGEVIPAETPTEVPVDVPTELPTEIPTESPTEAPTEAPTEQPTEAPTEQPTEAPTEAPTEVPTEAPTAEPTALPTEAPAEAATEAVTEPVAETVTEEPTEAPATDPTEAPVDASTEEPAAAPTEAPAEGDGPTPEATTDLPSGIVDAAATAGLPPQVEVQNASYVFTQVDVDIDIQALVEVDVVTINNTSLTVYAEQEFQGIAPVLYCVADDGAVIGRYVPVATTNPTPPPDLPATIDVESTTYVFNQVNINIDIQTLVEVNVIVVQNVELTIYTDQNVDGQPSRYFAVTSEGQVVGQYVESSLAGAVAQVTPQPTAQLQPPAVVPTQAPDAPPPAAVTAEPADTCAGSPGPINDQGVPSYLPNRIQLGGIAYALVGTEASGEAGELTRIDCISGFEILTTDQADRSEVLYLRIAGQGSAADAVYRFEAGVTYSVEFEVTGRPQRITGEEQQFRLVDTWLPSIYSSTTVILFVDDVENAAPDVFYAVNVYNTVVGEVVGEYRQAEANDVPSEEVVAAAGNAGINPDLTVESRRYLLVNVYTPAGTTTNGFVTLFSAAGEGEAEILLGRDKRRLELFVYDVIPAEETGG